MKRIRVLYGVWLAALVILLAACSMEYQPLLIWGTVRTTGFVLLGMLDLLSVLLVLTGQPFPEKVLYAEGQSAAAAEHAVPAETGHVSERTEDIRREKPVRGKELSGTALRQLLAFGGATVLYAVYCFGLDGMLRTNSTIDALVAGGLLCAAAAFSAGKQSARISG